MITSGLLLSLFIQREKQKNELVALRSKNEKLENLCRALHKGAKVTTTDIEQVLLRLFRSCIGRLVRERERQ